VTLRRGGIAVAAVLVLAQLLLASGARAAPGDLDPTFGDEGMVVTGLGDHLGRGWDLAIQPNGRLVVAGEVRADGLSDFDFLLARYTPDGSLDPTFGTNGFVVTEFGESASALTLAIQGDGKLVAAGGSHLARYHPNGSLDGTFGAGGKVSSAPLSIQALAIQGDGKLVAAGSANSDLAVARFNPDGSLDASFAANGLATLAIGPFLDTARDLAIQGDGKLVAAGVTFNHDGLQANASDFLLARFDPGGSPDPGFGAAGVVTTDFDGATAHARGLAIQGDGKLVAVGHFQPGLTQETADFAVARYQDDGSLDPSFGTNGLVTTDFEEGPDFGRAVAIQSDGKPVVAGSAFVSVTPSLDQQQFALTRYDAQGSLDTSFGDGGKVVTVFPNATTDASAVSLQGDGKIVAAGRARSGLGLARYLVHPFATDLDLTVPGRQDWRGPSADITALLGDAGTGDPLPGRTIRFFVDGAVIGEAVTDRHGVATVETPRRLVPEARIGAEFAGDPDHGAVSVEARYHPRSGASTTSRTDTER
jgi:uncharacterized delta-60 repeat protein